MPQRVPRLSAWRLRRGAAVPRKARVSIIMLVLDDSANAVQCLDSIAAAGGPPREIVVVANGTGDEGLAPLLERDDHVLLRLTVNTGFAAGCNLGSLVATSDLLLFLNDDVTVEPGWLEPLLRTAQDEPELGAVSSLLLFPDGRIQDAGGFVWRNGVPSRIGYGERELSVDAGRRHAVDYVSACSMLMTRAAWDRSGGFDTSFFPAYFEDVDLCLRLHGLGMRILCEPESRVRHHMASSSSDAWRQFIITRNHGRLMARWHDELASHENPTSLDGDALEEALEHAMRRVAYAA